MNACIPRIKKSLLASLLLSCSAMCLGQRGQQHARLSLITEQTALSPGSSQWIGLRFDLEPGWHIYWTNPGDSGEPPKVIWYLPNGLQVGDLQFPAPQRIQDHSLVDYGYQGQAVLLSKVTVPRAGDTSGKAEIAADVRYLVCREVCVPAKDHLSLSVPLVTATNEAKRIGPAPGGDQIRQASDRLPKPLPANMKLSVGTKDENLVVTLTSKSRPFPVVTDFIPADPQMVDNVTNPKIEAAKGTQTITLRKSEQFDSSRKELHGLLIAGEQAYSVTIPILQSRKSSADRSNPHKDHVSKKG